MMKRIILAGSVLSFLMVNAFAVLGLLQVNAFSCSGDSGTVNAAINDNFNCQATIFNSDQSSASITTVTLRTDGSWAESSTYSGSGFSTSINNGASTTATFTDIRSTISGPNKFSSILLDSVTDTYVADTTINIIDIKSLINTSNVSWASSDGDFEVSATAVAGGNINVDLNISVNSSTPEALGFSNTLGQRRCLLLNATNNGNAGNITQNLGTLNDGNSAGNPQKWMIVMGDTECNYTIFAKGVAGAVSVIKSITATIYNSSSVSQVQGSTPSISSSSSGGGGGGGGGGGTSLVSESVVVPTIPLGFSGFFNYKKSNDISVYEIEAVPLSEAIQASITVKEANLAAGEKPAIDSDEGMVFRYISIVSDKLGNVSKATIKFKVPLSWFVNNSLSSSNVELRRLKNGVWNPLKTVPVRSDAEYSYFSADSPGLSIFAISAKKQAVVIKTENAPLKNDTVLPENKLETIFNKTEEPAKKDDVVLRQVFQGKTGIGIGYVAFILIAAVIAIYLIIRRRK